MAPGVCSMESSFSFDRISSISSVFSWTLIIIKKKQSSYSKEILKQYLLWFLTSSFERTEFICSVIFWCLMSFPRNKFSQRRPPAWTEKIKISESEATILTLTSNVLHHAGSKSRRRLSSNCTDLSSLVLSRTCLQSLRVIIVFQTWANRVVTFVRLRIKVHLRKAMPSPENVLF